MRLALLTLLGAAAGVQAGEYLPPTTPPSTPGAGAADSAAGADEAGTGAVVVAQEDPKPPPPPPPPIFIDWERLAENIITSSLLASNKQSFLFKHGLTVETDIKALVSFFNNTAASYEGTTPSNPYRGAMARMSEWKNQEGWSSIVTAHSEVAVQCKALYMEGGAEFKAKNCYWNVDALRGANGVEVLRYPDPWWSIVFDCCELLQRPVLQLSDAVWATTRGVGRVKRAPDAEGVIPGVIQRADDFDYVPKVDCDAAVNQGILDCDPTSFNLHTPSGSRCNQDTGCSAATRPVGVRSKHYFNVGLAVGDGGMIVRSLDGGYTWQCLRSCTGEIDPESKLTSISVNVHMGGVGYSQAYYSATASNYVDGVYWDQLILEGETTGQGLDGIYWKPETFMEGWAVGTKGTIVQVVNAGVSGWDWDDPEQVTPDTVRIVEVDPVNVGADGLIDLACRTTRNINDVFFWNNHLGFFVGDQGFLCRFGLTPDVTAGPGSNVGVQAEGDKGNLLVWEAQGADEQALNWGKIVDEPAYRYSNFKAVFCLQVGALETLEWVAFDMSALGGGITYSQHITCFAVGSHPEIAGTTSAILRYTSRSVFKNYNADTQRPEFSEQVEWKPQDSRTSTTLNDVYCVKSRDGGDWLGVNDNLYCYAVGDGGLIRYTANGGTSPWRTLFSGVKENLRKVVIIGVTHDERGFGAGGSNAGQQAVIVGDNGRLLYTNDGGNTWEIADRVSPEHLVAVQFNAFDDFFYAAGGTSLSAEANYFEASSSLSLPFGNGIVTGSVLFDWPRLSGDCGVGSPNQGPNINRRYDCKLPEVSTVLRTNCGGTLTSQQWRCRRECGVGDTVPVILQDSLASDALWRNYFGYEVEEDNQGVVELVDNMDRSGNRGQGIALLANVPACDEVWTVGHGAMWHEDTRETRRFQNFIDPETNGPYLSYADTVAIKPSDQMCLYGWPRHAYQLHEGRLPLKYQDGNRTVTRERNIDEYDFLNRLRPNEENCSLVDGTFYPSTCATCLDDCVVEFGAMTSCPSWEVHGMAHSRDVGIIFTNIPFVNYSSITDPCGGDSRERWYGVTCEAYEDDVRPSQTANQTVTQMWLYSNNLQGAIPEELVSLTSLRSLSLGSNLLDNGIPPEVWSNMSQLRYLSLAGNQLTGAVPSELGAISTLEELRLHANSLEGSIPPQLGGLPALLSLSLHENRLGGALPTELGAASTLQYLWLSNNNISGPLPSQLGNLSQLRFLWFANNSVTSLPRQLGALLNLRSLDGSNNSIADRLPYAFGKLQNLRKLQLHHNAIRATVPDALGLCTSLVVLELQHNQLVGPIPASFGGLQQLTLLDLSHNLLERRIPASVEAMHALQVLILNDNFLEGGLPPQVGRLRKLYSINVANNLLSDPLPEELVNCDMLELLNLEGNSIGGVLPQGIWRLQRLEYLVLNDNRLTGPLPEGIGYLSEIRELKLHNNRIDGTLPDTIGDAFALEILRLDNNRMSGPLPPSIGRLRNVHYFDVHGNAFQGSIPSELDGLHSVEYLYLDHNALAAQVPFTVGNLSLLKDLRLSHNLLTGEIPPTLGKLELLVSLSIDNNQVGGSIPQELGDLELRLQTLQLQNNQLNGLIPTFFKRQPFRTMQIDLAANPFWCPLPAWPTIYTASCVHCPNDTYVGDKHRTCSDHGVCIDGERCRCDPRWYGGDCEQLRCPNKCNFHGDCEQRRTPEVCQTNSTADPTAGLCQAIDDDCVAAYQDCPSNGVSLQIDSEGVVIAVEPRHNTILFAYCVCTDEWSGNDCTIPPPEPPTEQPWPDPYANFVESAAPRDARRPTLLLGGALALAAAAALTRGNTRRHFWGV